MEFQAGGSDEGAAIVDDTKPHSGLICKLSGIIKALALKDGAVFMSGLLMRDYERTSTPVVTQRSYGYDACELGP